MTKRFYSAAELYQMVVSCYFTGKCKGCPFWKQDKISPLGRCLGGNTVGTALLDLLEPLTDAEKAKEPPTLFDLPEEEQEEEASAA